MSRRDHAAEMRYALAHNCSLDEARRALAKLRWRAAQEARNKAEDTDAHRSMPTAEAAQPQFWWDRD